jgi:type IV fimbrial biogenesis protein FimT
MQTHNTHSFRRAQSAPGTARQRGFTMTELGVTMVIAAVLATVALPSFQGIIATQRARTYASALYASLSKARSEAITLNANVTVQPKAGGWTAGWQILDVNNNVLDDYTATSGINVPTAPATVTYSSSGRMPGGATPAFKINTVSGHNTNYQCVSVTPSGRPYMQAMQSC